jgi:hypothetical protein
VNAPPDQYPRSPDPRSAAGEPVSAIGTRRAVFFPSARPCDCDRRQRRSCRHIPGPAIRARRDVFGLVACAICVLMLASSVSHADGVSFDRQPGPVGTGGAVGVSAEAMEKIECVCARYSIFALERSMSMISLRMRSFA